MFAVKPCNTYHAVLSGTDMLRLPNGKSVFKVYFVDIVGRKDPARTVWDQCGFSRQDFLASLAKQQGIEGVGFIVAFPHITKVFRFGPEMETVLNVRGWNTKDMSPLNLSRTEGYVEFACLAEAAIAAEEYAFWAEADSVEDYLTHWSAFKDGPVARHDKLLAYWKTQTR